MPNEDLALMEYDYRNSSFYYANLQKIFGGGAKISYENGFFNIKNDVRKHITTYNYSDYTNRMTKKELMDRYPNINANKLGYGLFLVTDDNNWVINNISKKIYVNSMN